ncbi:ALG10 family protein [Megaselia abdita]
MHSLHFYLLPVVYLAISIPLFYKVYDASKMIIDEEFHLKQAKFYCMDKFGVWDPKITTFPGLYLVSYWLLPFHYCTTFYLRMISLVASVVNVVFILRIRNQGDETNIWNMIVETFNIAILPPMYFFAHLYYTDILSITSVLALYYYWSEKKHFKAAVCGAGSILMRQTNVVWVIMVMGITALEELCRNYSTVKKVTPNSVDVLNPRTVYDIIINNPLVVMESVCNILRQYHIYISVIASFLVFVVFNGSIVVGDKTAHQAVIHLPQMLYFSLFVLIFGGPAFKDFLRPTLKTLAAHWKLALRFTALVSIAVAYNTMVHPYLLADNRHYTFYFWNRFYGKYSWFKFAIVPLYVFALFLCGTVLNHKSKNFKIMFWLCSFVVLVPQKLLEIRYFLIPFILLRLNCSRLSRSSLLLELVSYLFLNCLVYYVFFTKNIYWDNYQAPQKLIW